MNGLEMKYFVLKPEGNDRYAAAARKAMRAYAHHIGVENTLLARDLLKWSHDETVKMQIGMTEKEDESDE